MSAEIPDFVGDLAGAVLGDARLVKTLVKLGRVAEEAPSRSFPEMCSSESQLTGVYRVLSNARVTAGHVLKPHAEAAVLRANSHERVLVISDTTTLNFGSRRRDLGPISGGGGGFLFHVALGVESKARLPLGVLGFETWVQESRPRGAGRRRGGTGEGLRWARVANEAARRCASLDRKPIHVMDCEADAYPLMSALKEGEERFIIRAKHDRHVNVDGEKTRLFTVATAIEERERRVAHLSSRRRKGIPHADKAHPPRPERTTRLEIGARSVTIPRPTKGVEKSLPSELEINIVHVREIDAPKGLEPVEWLLLTTEPSDTVEEILQIVDDYRARWVVEEFFKALKTGCAMEARQLETRQALENALALFVPIACQMLFARTLARYGAAVPATAMLTERQLKVLTLLAKKTSMPLPPSPTARDALLSIARLGGHLRSNGAPGWLVLARGFRKLYDALDVLSLVLEDETRSVRS